MAGHSYSLNASNAAKIGGTGRINATGPYEGAFTRAEAVISDKGTFGVEFDFKTNDGATASFLSVWTEKSNGELLSGAAIIDALLLLMRVNDVEPKPIQVDKWDKVAKAVTKQRCECFPELMNKPIGLLLQKELSEYQGQPKERMLIYGAYDIASRKTPKEIVSKAPKAQALETIIGSLKDKHAKPQSSPAYSGGGGGEPPAYFDDMPNVEF